MEFDLAKHFDIKYFDQFIGNEKWKNKIDCPICDLPRHYGIIGEYDNINIHEGNISEGRSQNGEDGLLKYLFKKIKIIHKYCVEFGGGDGEWLSNIYYFRKKLNWNYLLMEGRKEEVIKGNRKGVKFLYNEFITPENINNLFEI